MDILHSHWYGHGGTDISGEFEYSGDDYIYIHRDSFDKIKHNYYINLYKTRKKKLITIDLCLTAVNSADISIFKYESKTIKDAKANAVEFLKEFDSSSKPNELIEVWKNKRATPIFDLELNLIGTSYGYVGMDMDYVRGTLGWGYERKKSNDTWHYYNDDIPDYNTYSKVYSLEKSRLDEHLYINYHECRGWGRSSSGVQNEELLERLIETIKNNPKFNYLLERKNG